MPAHGNSQSELLLMIFKNKYFAQEKPPTTLGSKILFLVKAPVLLPRWIISFLLSRAMTNVILSPTYAGPQKKIHSTAISYNPEENTHVIVNLIPHDSYKKLRDYVLKFCSIFNLNFLAPKRTILKLKNPQDKAYVDALINDIGSLMNGDSTADKCQGKKFNWEDIHLKGLEYFNSELRDYLFTQLRIKHGSALDKPPALNIDFYNLATPDAAVLDSVAVSLPAEEHIPIEQRKFVITCLANGQNYIDWLKDFHFSAKEIGCTVIGFNYRGVDYSQGMIWTEENMIADAIAQVKNLFALGARAENIGLEGMCLGGAVATLSAARLHEEGLKVKLYNERSFRSIPRTLAGALMPGVNRSLLNPLSWLQYAGAALVYCLCYPFIWLAGWRMDVGSAWDRIPLADKGYSVVRNMDDRDPKAPKEDGVIEDRYASLASLVDEHRVDARKKREAGAVLNEEESQLLADDPERHNFKVNPQHDRKNKRPHVLARRHLIKACAEEATHMHQDMVEHFKHTFFKPIATLDLNNPYQENRTHVLSI